MNRINWFQQLIHRLYLGKSEMEKMLTLSIAFSMLLIICRIIYTGEWLFVSLVWNLFLAYIPYALTRLLSKRPGWREQRWKLGIISFVWLLFIPNSFYIITDLFHLKMRNSVPMWFDLALIFSFAWNGLLLGVLSVRQMEKIWQLRWRWSEIVFIYPVMWLNALGIYIGRYLRYNSWDVVSDPLDLSEDILYLIVHPIRNRFDWSMIFCFSVFMTLLYLTVKKMGKEIHQS